MAKTIAICGKGGSGKTTVAAMMSRLLKDVSADAVLAVDADPNSCLGFTLGVDVVSDIAALREKARNKEPREGGTDRVRTFQYGLQQIITEAEGFDLLTMGRPEGPDCYCAVNNLLRKFLDDLSAQYGFVVLDNEAGMEHLSRRTTNNVDLLCIVAEPSPIGKITARRIHGLAEQLPIAVKKTGLIWNKAESIMTLDNIECIGAVPYDHTLFDASRNGNPIFDCAMDSPAFLAVKKILEQELKVSIRQ